MHGPLVLISSMLTRSFFSDRAGITGGYQKPVEEGHSQLSQMSVRISKLYLSR